MTSHAPASDTLCHFFPGLACHQLFERLPSGQLPASTAATALLMGMSTRALARQSRRFARGIDAFSDVPEFIEYRRQ